MPQGWEKAGGSGEAASQGEEASWLKRETASAGERKREQKGEKYRERLAEKDRRCDTENRKKK